jgi:hypothetical protein
MTYERRMRSEPQRVANFDGKKAGWIQTPIQLPEVEYAQLRKSLPGGFYPPSNHPTIPRSPATKGITPSFLRLIMAPDKWVMGNDPLLNLNFRALQDVSDHLRTS